MAVDFLNSEKLDFDFSNINGYYGENQMMNWYAPPTAIRNVNGIDYESTPYGVPMDEPFWFKERRNYLRNKKANSITVDIVPTALPSGDRLEDFFSSFTARLESNLTDEDLSVFSNMTDEECSEFFMNVIANLNPNDIGSYGVGENYSNGIGDWFSDAVKNVTKSAQDAVKSTQDAIKVVQKNVETKTKEAIKSTQDAIKTVQTKGVIKALEEGKKEAEKLAKDAVKNIEQTTKDAIKSVKDGVESVKKWIGDNLGGGVALHALNKFNPLMLIARGATISIIALNVVGIASALYEVKKGSQKRWDEILQKWWLLGGEKDKFDEFVTGAYKKDKLFISLIGKKGFDGNYSYAEGETSPAQIVLYSATALTVITSILAVFPDPTSKAVALWTGASAGVFGALGGILKGFAKDKGASDKETSKIPDKEIPPPPIPEKEAELAQIQAEVNLLKSQGTLPTGDTPQGTAPRGLTKAEADAITIQMGGKVTEPSTNPMTIIGTTVAKSDTGANKGVIEKALGGTDAGSRLAGTPINTTSDTGSGKILGMPKTVFFIGVGVIALVGGFLIYRKFKK